MALQEFYKFLRVTISGLILLYATNSYALNFLTEASWRPYKLEVNHSGTVSPGHSSHTVNHQGYLKIN